MDEWGHNAALISCQATDLAIDTATRAEARSWEDCNDRQIASQARRAPTPPFPGARSPLASAVSAAGMLAGTGPFSIGRAQGAPLKVGVLLPRSGVQAGIGQDCQRGVEIAAGILKDLGLPDLAIMNGDTESNVEVARSRAERLISEGAQLLVGAFDSGQTHGDRAGGRAEGHSAT